MRERPRTRTDGTRLLGDCLKAVRRRRGLTLKQVSERTGLAVSTLSKVENHLMSLTYDKLLQISGGLRVDIAELFQRDGTPTAAAGAASRRSVNRRGDGQLVEAGAYRYFYQSTDLIGKLLVPIVTELKARTIDEFGPMMSHPGEEYFLVMEGKVEVRTQFYAPLILEAGDSVYIDSTMAHAYLNVGEGAARAVCVCSADHPDLLEAVADLPRSHAFGGGPPLPAKPANARPRPVASRPRRIAGRS